MNDEDTSTLSGDIALPIDSDLDGEESLIDPEGDVYGDNSDLDVNPEDWN